MTSRFPNRDKMLPSRRQEQGIVHLADTLNWWLAKAELSAEQLSRISSWALGERSRLMPSNISNLRNAKANRPNLFIAEALAATNEAIWRWQVKGEQDCLAYYGPLSTWGARPEWMNAAVWLHHPEDASDPLCFADFCELFAGMLTLPYVGVSLSPTENLSPAIAALFKAETEQAGPMAETMIRLAYPVQDPDRIGLLLDVIAGKRDYGREELEDELTALALTIGKLRGLPEGSLSPEGLRSELSSGRKRT